jgi:hypothetical protein
MFELHSVDGVEADEAHSPWRIQQPRAGIVQGNHLLQHTPVYAVRPIFVVAPALIDR